MYSAPARWVPPPASVCAVAREVAARLAGVHDVATHKLRLNVAFACIMFDWLLGLAACAALLANAAPIEAAVRHATAMLLTQLPSRGCANASRLRCAHAPL